MAGTDIARMAPPAGGPTVILVEPQLGENIGTAARAMANFGLSSLRVVNPRDGWPSDKARAACSGADFVIDAATIWPTAADAVADLHFVYAATARPRGMAKTVTAPEAAAIALRAREAAGQRTGILFGRERWGLDNDEVALADEILTFPTNPGFSSLNLAQSVLLVGYEWLKAGIAGADVSAGDARPRKRRAMPAERADLLRFFAHFEAALDDANFLRPPEKRASMVRSLRNLFHRAQLTDQDVRTLRGVVSALERRHERGHR